MTSRGTFKTTLHPDGLRRYTLLTPANVALSTEAPTVKVAQKAGYDGRETLICRAHGFYPKEIEVTWMKDGEDQKPDTFTGGVLPNSDGTYHTWLSIEVDSQERDRFRCQVAHDSLPEPLDFTWEEPASDLGLILGLTVGLGLILVCLILYRTFAIKQQQEMGYEITPVSVPEVENIEGLLKSSGGSISRDPDFHLPPDF
uniref:Uncharacterized protein n=1 Tax=Sphaerodactylus townsendi TaxID=933632 RepID=A0ACB8EF57_9SAUR